MGVESASLSKHVFFSDGERAREERLGRWPDPRKRMLPIASDPGGILTDLCLRTFGNRPTARAEGTAQADLAKDADFRIARLF